MIFLTVGTQLPFDRLVKVLDQVAPQLDEEVFGQIGAGSYVPMHFDAVRRLPPAEFNDRFSNARMIVGHAGIGTILSGQKFGKTLALMARRHALGEHRNDHQLATAAQVARIDGVSIFDTADELLDICLRRGAPSMQNIGSATRQKLIDALRDEILARSARN